MKKKKKIRSLFMMSLINYYVAFLLLHLYIFQMAGYSYAVTNSKVPIRPTRM